MGISQLLEGTRLGCPPSLCPCLLLPQLFSSLRCSRHSTDTVPELYAEAPQATVSEGLAQGPYVKAGAEPMTL